MHEALDYTINLLSAETLKTGIDIIKNYTKEKSMIYADSVKLKHVFFNMIKNGMESLSSKGKITISTSRDRDRFKIDIADNGCGIKKADLDRVFEPFFSLKDRGTGLGLPVSQSIISEHNGTIFAQSTPGAGTTFTISLPLALRDGP